MCVCVCACAFVYRLFKYLYMYILTPDQLIIYYSLPMYNEIAIHCIFLIRYFTIVSVVFWGPLLYYI